MRRSEHRHRSGPIQSSVDMTGRDLTGTHAWSLLRVEAEQKEACRLQLVTKARQPAQFRSQLQEEGMTTWLDIHHRRTQVVHMLKGPLEGYAHLHSNRPKLCR
jgi:hypothetical protein